MVIEEKIQELINQQGLPVMWHSLTDAVIEIIERWQANSNADQDDKAFCFHLAQNMYYAFYGVVPEGEQLNHISEVGQAAEAGKERKYVLYFFFRFLKEPWEKNPVALTATSDMLFILKNGLHLDCYRRLQEQKKGIIDNITEIEKSMEEKDDAVDALGKLRAAVKFKRTPGNGFMDVAGMDELKRQLKDEVLWVLMHREQAAKYRLKAPNGMLLYGPPGCGKTFFGKKLAEECDLPFAYVQGSDLGNVYYHGTQTAIAQMFVDAEAAAPCILFLDEIDTVICKRGNVDNNMRNQETTEFLTQMNNCAERGIFVIGATNYPDNVDPAVLRTGRLDIHIYVPLPDAETRRQLFCMQLDHRPIEDGINCERLAQLSDGLSCSDIPRIVNKAAIKAAISDIPISQQMLEDAIADYAVQAKVDGEGHSLNNANLRITPPAKRRIGFVSAAYKEKKE